MSDQYTPTYGTDLFMFIETWCRRCQRDKAMREGAPFYDRDDNEFCEIIAASFRGPVKEWIEDESGPRCTAFVEAGQAVPFVDTKTMDLFTYPSAHGAPEEWRK